MFKVYIETHPVGSVNLFICDRLSESRVRYYNVTKDGHFEIEEIDTTEAVDPTEFKPTMVIPRHMWDGFSQALLTALMESGVKPKEQSFVEGKLEATEKHLIDMRELVFGKGGRK